MTDTRLLEMRLHRINDKLSKLESELEKVTSELESQTQLMENMSVELRLLKGIGVRV